MFDFIDEAVQGVGELFAGRDHSAPTDEQPQQCTPEDAGPLGFLGEMGQAIGDIGRGLSQEGLSGLLDPAGMIDRQQAQRELADQFQIMNPEEMVCGPDGSGEYAGNQVSPEEFQRIASTYSDIRMGRTNFQFNTSEMTPEGQAQYQQDMMNQFGRVMQTDSGRQLVNDIAYNERNHQVTLGAYYQTDAAGNQVLDAAGNPVLDTTNAEANPHNEANAANSAAGSGSDVRINPGVDRYNVGHSSDAWNQTRGDVVLYHELSHARHQVLGTEDQSGAVGPGEVGADGTARDGATNAAGTTNIQRWEHQAVGLGNHLNDTGPNENRYRRERAEIGATGGPGVVEGDVNMPQRDHYGNRLPPPPGP